MNMISRDERKRQKGIKKFFNSFAYAIKGFKYAYRNEQNLAVDVGVALLVVIAGFIFKISTFEWISIAIVIGLMFALELLNTALEALVDLVTDEYHPLAKVAKDTSAAAVMVFSFVSAIIGLIIFIPKLIEVMF